MIHESDNVYPQAKLAKLQIKESPDFETLKVVLFSTVLSLNVCSLFSIRSVLPSRSTSSSRASSLVAGKQNFMANLINSKRTKFGLLNFTP